MKSKQLLWIIPVVMLLPTLVFLIYLNNDVAAEMERLSEETTSGVDYLSVHLSKGIGFITLAVTAFLAIATTRESFNLMNPKKNKKFAGILLGTSASAYVLYWLTFVATATSLFGTSVFLEELPMLLSLVLMLTYIIAKFVGIIVSLGRKRCEKEIN